MTRSWLRLFALLTTLSLVFSLIVAPVAADDDDDDDGGRGTPTVDIQILNVSDWHGNLDPVNGFGGAWSLSARFQQDRLAYPTLTLTAGDDFGATPPLSGFFDEEPAILAQRMMGIQVGTFGNHNFDRGIAHLQSMIDLARAQTSASVPGSPFTYVSANLKNRDRNLRGVRDFRIFRVGGIKVGVVGITNPEAPGLVFPGSFGTIVPTDPYVAAKKARKAAREAGADVVVAITHMGVRGFDSAGQPFGELIDFANNVTGFDVIFGDHTDIQFSGTVNGQLVHENRSFGVTYAKTLLTVNRRSGKVIASSVSFVSPTAPTLAPGNTTCPPAPAFCDQAVLDMIAPFRTQLAALLDVEIGTSSGLFVRGGNIERRQEVPLGDLIADGMRARYDTQLGFMNSGGIRRSLPADNYLPADTTLRRLAAPYVVGPPFDLVLGDIHTVLPFNNVIATRTVTGDQLWAMLENGVSQIDAASGTSADGRFPQISGFKFTFDFGNPTGCTGTSFTPTWNCGTASRVTSVQLTDGTPILPDATTYTIALPNFLLAGGDSYTMLVDGQGVSRELDAAVLRAHIEAIGPNIDPASFPLDRITKVP